MKWTEESQLAIKYTPNQKIAYFRTFKFPLNFVNFPKNTREIQKI